MIAHITTKKDVEEKRKKNYQQFNKLVLDKRKYIDKLGDFFSYTDTFKKSMSSVKKYLKSAKAALESNDPLLALEHAGDALEEDPNCYFAHVFQGKSYQLLRDIPKAIAAFQKATEIEPDNLLAWKGYFQVVRTTDDYKLFLMYSLM